MMDPQITNKFHRAAFEPPYRSELLAELQADPTLLKAAKSEVQRLNDGQAGPGRLLDRDHISRMVRDTLTSMLAYIAANPMSPAEIIEKKAAIDSQWPGGRLPTPAEVSQETK